jgi:glucokinase
MKAMATSFIAADIGGTRARIGLMRNAFGGAQLQTLAYQDYICANYSSLDLILRDFMERHVDMPVTSCVLGCAGRVVNGRVVINNNLPWKVVRDELRDVLDLPDLSLINDFEALAYATKYIDPHTTRLLTPMAETPTGGAQVVVGPGTGLGSAVLIPGDAQWHVLATEAGQIALAPGNSLEAEILAVFADTGEYVPYDRVLSGPGLLNVYGVLCALQSSPAVLKTPESVTTAALRGDNPQARQALDVFCGLLGSFAGDLAMLYGASGGVWLAGGFLPKIYDFLVRSDFVARFLNKGRMREFLETVPVRLIEHGQLGVIGAATWYIERQGGVA